MRTLAAIALLLAHTGCASTGGKPAPAVPVFTPAVAGADAQPAATTKITIIHRRPEARDYVHP